MLGKIIDMNITDAYISFEDGTTMDIGVSHLPPHSKIGDTVNIDFNSINMINDKLTGLL